MTKQEAGRLGGQQTVARYGPAYMSGIGQKGADSFHRQYTIQPVDLSGWAVVRRADGMIVKVFGNAYLDRRAGG